MASKKTFKPPVKNNSQLVRKPNVSLTNKEYDEIFDAVINPSQQGLDLKSPTLPTAADISGCKAQSPKESASVENSQNSQPNPAANTENTINAADILKNQAKPSVEIFAQPAKNTDTSSLSTINSEDFIKNAVFSTPNKIVKPPRTYREALNNLRNIQEKLKDSESESESILRNSITDLIGDGPLSQPPSHLSKIERLKWCQERRGTGLWVQCDIPNCDKWRWLEEADPCKLPKKWYCHMNPDPAYASCGVPEKPIPLEVEMDLIFNNYTAGSIVWGKIPGFPWWPAMVDDSPDEETFYWIDDPEISDTPDWYHVVFFDDVQVSRKWLRLPQIKSFIKNPDYDKKFKVNQIFKRRIELSKEKANEALTIHVKDRLKKFSFISLWDGDLPKAKDSDSDREEKKVVKKKTNQRTKKITNKAQKKNNLDSPRDKIQTRRSSRSSIEDEKSSQEIVSPKDKVVNTKKQSQSSKKCTEKSENKTDLIEKVYNSCYKQFKSGKMDLSKFEEIFKELKRESSQELSAQTPKSPPKRNNPVESSRAETSSEPSSKKIKKDTTSTNVVKKVKKSFVMPVKKNVDLNSSSASISTVGSAANGPEKIYED